jgi:hypothetical protein
MLDACAKLTDEQFHHRFEIGPGSLHDTFFKPQLKGVDQLFASDAPARSAVV